MTKDLNYWKKEFRDLHQRSMEHYNCMSSKWTPIEQIAGLILLELTRVVGSHNLSVLAQERIENYRVDFLVRFCPLHNLDASKNIIIECDGHEWHEKTKEQAQKDKERDRTLTKLGYIVFRYTGSEIVDDPWKIYKDVEELLLPDYAKRGYGYRSVDTEG